VTIYVRVGIWWCRPPNPQQVRHPDPVSITLYLVQGAKSARRRTSPTRGNAGLTPCSLVSRPIHMPLGCISSSFDVSFQNFPCCEIVTHFHSKTALRQSLSHITNLIVKTLLLDVLFGRSNSVADKSSQSLKFSCRKFQINLFGKGVEIPLRRKLGNSQGERKTVANCRQKVIRKRFKFHSGADDALVKRRKK
jgi:hypothetical protein